MASLPRVKTSIAMDEWLLCSATAPNITGWNPRHGSCIPVQEKYKTTHVLYWVKSTLKESKMVEIIPEPSTAVALMAHRILNQHKYARVKRWHWCVPKQIHFHTVIAWYSKKTRHSEFESVLLGRRLQTCRVLLAFILTNEVTTLLSTSIQAASAHYVRSEDEFNSKCRVAFSTASSKQMEKLLRLLLTK